MTAGVATAQQTTRSDEDLAARWRRLAVYGYQAIDMAIDCSPSERVSILVEAASELDGGIDEVDALAMAAECVA